MHFFKNPNYDFVRWRWHAIAFSLVVIIAGMSLIATRGLQKGVDFEGGTIVILKFDQQPDLSRIRGALGSSMAGGGDAVDIGRLQAAVGHGVQRGVGVQADHGHVRNDAHLGGFRGPDDRDGFRLHVRCSYLAGAKSGRLMSSFCLANDTWSGMSSCSASGVCGQPVMFVIMVGPSASFTTAMA